MEPLLWEAGVIVLIVESIAASQVLAHASAGQDGGCAKEHQNDVADPSKTNRVEDADHKKHDPVRSQLMPASISGTG